MYTAIQLVINAIYLAIWGYILFYIYKLEQIGCECSKDWRRDFIKFFIIFMIVIFVLRMFDLWSPAGVPPVLMTLQFVAVLFFVAVVFQYVHELKVKKCQCSEDLARDVLEVVNYVQMFLLGLALLLMVHVMFTIAYSPALLKKMAASKKLVSKKK